MANWLTDHEGAALYWEDAPADDEGLSTYLDAAREACESYGPALDDPEDIPASWVLAQAMQARNIWNSGNAGAGGDFDGGGYGLSTHPLDWQVKQLLRPRRVLGAIV